MLKAVFLRANSAAPGKHDHWYHRAFHSLPMALRVSQVSHQSTVPPEQNIRFTPYGGTEMCSSVASLAPFAGQTPTHLLSLANFFC